MRQSKYRVFINSLYLAKFKNRYISMKTNNA